MPTYELDLIIQPADLANIQTAQESIVIAKPVNNASGTPNVAWLCFAPIQTAKVSWQEQYAIYASTTQIQSGATIAQASATNFPASDGICYGYSGNFTPNVTGPMPVSPGSYSVFNQMANPSIMTFGLTQSALVNGSSINLTPINAQAVLTQQQAVFTPYTTVWVWLQATVASGSVITNVYSKVAIVTFGGSVTKATLEYSGPGGVFVASSSSSALAMSARGGAKPALAAASSAQVQNVDFTGYAR